MLWVARHRAIKADIQATRQLRHLIATDNVIVLLPLDGQPAGQDRGTYRRLGVRLLRPAIVTHRHSGTEARVTYSLPI